MPTTASTSNTPILDLDDDCLLEVFKRLALADLCTAADVCNRFHLTARNHYASTTVNGVLLNVLWTKYGFRFLLGPRSEAVSHTRKIILRQQKLFNQKLLHLSKLLRNFGDLSKFAGIYETDMPFVNQSRFEKSIFDLICLYCGGTLSELILINCQITDEIEFTLRPLLRNLQFLQMMSCKHSAIYGRMLSSWSPELRVLQASHDGLNRARGRVRLDEILRQSFPKLELLALSKAFLANNDNL